MGNTAISYADVALKMPARRWFTRLLLFLLRREPSALDLQAGLLVEVEIALALAAVLTAALVAAVGRRTLTLAGAAVDLCGGRTAQ